MVKHIPRIYRGVGIYNMKNTKNRTYGFLYDFWVFVVGESTDVNFTQETKLQYGSLTYHVGLRREGEARTEKSNIGAGDFPSLMRHK